MAAPIAAADPQPEIGTIRGRPVRAAARTIGSADRPLPGAALPSSQNAADAPGQRRRGVDHLGPVHRQDTHGDERGIAGDLLEEHPVAHLGLAQQRGPVPDQGAPDAVAVALLHDGRQRRPARPAGHRAELDVDVDEPELRHRTLLRVMDHRA